MMKLVDDHHIEVLRVEAAQVCRVQALDRGEYVVEAGWSPAAHPVLAKVALSYRMSKRGEALIENLLTVGDEEKSVAWKLTPDPRKIDGCHDRLSGPSRGNEKVAVVALVTRQRDVLEEGLLERAQFDLNGALKRAAAPGRS